MNQASPDEIRAAVRAQYGNIARHEAPSCAPGCCGALDSQALGYSAEELAALPPGADLGLGCGNPQALAALRPGEVVLDLGAGAGIDCLLAARQVGPRGHVIGVDMTPEMVAKARANARAVHAGGVEFRLGEIEHLPVADQAIDVILSNCVLNLSPDKDAVFREAFRVLRPGGRLAISDVVALQAIPEAMARDAEALTHCVSGAATVEALRGLLSAAGFTTIEIHVSPESRAFIRNWLPGAEEYIASATISATRPGARACCAPSCCEEETAP